jgi:hypothetical protein
VVHDAVSTNYASYSDWLKHEPTDDRWFEWERYGIERGWKEGPPEPVAGDTWSLPVEASTTSATSSTATVSVGIDAADLLAMDLPPLRMIVPGLLPEGTSIIAAHPKTGKSCLVYQVATEVSLGGELFDTRVVSGSALYFALEDGLRRGRDRLKAALAGRTMPRNRLEVRWSAPRIGEGLEDEVAAWLDQHPDAALVAIDTLGRVRPKGGERGNAYHADVENVGVLQGLFRDRHVALVLVHHLRKGASSDFVEHVSGTYGISGSVDTIIHIDRKRNEQFGTISLTGRDIADAKFSVRFDEMTWTAAPEAVTDGSFQRTAVYRAIEEIGPAWPKQIADHLGLERTAVQHLCGTLVEGSAVVRTANGYALATHPTRSYTPSHSSHSESEESEGGEKGHWIDYPRSAWDPER